MVLGVYQDSQSRRQKHRVRRVIASVVALGVVAGGVAFPAPPSQASVEVINVTVDCVAKTHNGPNAVAVGATLRYTAEGCVSKQDDSVNISTSVTVVSGQLGNAQPYVVDVEITGVTGSNSTLEVAFSDNADIWINRVAHRALVLAPAAAPGNVVGTVSDASVSLTWDFPTDLGGGSTIDSYEVRYSDDNAASFSTPISVASLNGLVRSLTLGGLINGTEYLFEVRAVVSGVNGLWGRSSGLTPTKPPPAPTAVTAVAGQNKVTVSWTAPPLEQGMSAIEHYEVQVRTAQDTTWRAVVPETTTQTSVDVEQFSDGFNQINLRAGTAYEFRVFAVNPAGPGDPGVAAASATPFDVPDQVDTNPPMMPGGTDGFVVTQTGDTAFTLSWDAPQDNGKPILRYDVEFAEDAGPMGTPSWQAATGSCGTGTLLARTCELTGLTPGTAYLFRIRAVNDVGDGPWGETWQGEIVVGPAAAPDQLSGLTSDGKVSLSWREPTNWGGLRAMNVCAGSPPHVTYEVQTFADGLWGSVVTHRVDCVQPSVPGPFFPSHSNPSNPGHRPEITFDVTGLTNGEPYDFRVRVVVNDRAGQWAEVQSIVPSTLPSQVSSVTAVRGDTEVGLSWDAPHDGGSPIIGYHIEKDDGSGWTDAVADTQSDATSFTVTGLTNGTTYTFRVSAINANTSAYLADGFTVMASSPSNAVTPVALPGAPTGLSATRGNEEVSLTWTVVDSQVTGEELVGHRIQQSTDNGASWSDAIADTASVAGAATVTGLTNGTAYLFRVSGISAAGSGQYVTLATEVTPSTTPDAPASVTAVAGNGEVTLSWDAPHDGGSVITGYRIEKHDGGGWTVAEANTGNAQTTFTVTNLTNGTSYDFRVVPINQNGASLTASPGLTSRVTPVEPPGVPAQPVAVAGPGSVTVTVTKGSGGDPASFTVTSDPEARTCTVTGTGGSCTVTGLTPGTAYTFTAVAQNGAGTSQASVVSDAATPLALPTPPPPPTVTVPPSSGAQDSQGNGQREPQGGNPGDSGSSGDAGSGPSSPGASGTPVNGVRPSPGRPTPAPVLVEENGASGTGGTPIGVPNINGSLNGTPNGVNGAGRVSVLAAPASPVPTLLSAAQLGALNQTPGGVTVTVNGVTQTATVLRFDGVVAANGATPSPETTAQLLAYGNTIVSALRDVTPNVDDVGVRVEEKDGRVFFFGAAVQPSDPSTSLGVPVEHVVTVVTGDTAVLVAGVNADDEPAPLSPSGALRINRDGYVAVSAFGLPAGAEGEVVVMSTPQSLGQFTVGADGGFSGQVQLPDGLIGEHTVVLAAGSVANAVGIEIIDDTDVVADATGDGMADGASNMLLRLVALLAGLFFVWLLVKRRMVKREPVTTRH